MKKVTLATVKRLARQQFRADGRGINVSILPNKVRLSSMWVHPCNVNIETDETGVLFAYWNDCAEPFESFLNSYKYYNCISELSKGRGVHYYIED